MREIGPVLNDKNTYSRHFMNINTRRVKRRMMPNTEAITTNTKTSLKPCPGSSMYSMPSWIRGSGDDSHMNVAKHGCVSFWANATCAVFGSKKDGSGGGGIDKIESGGGSMQWIHIFKLYAHNKMEKSREFRDFQSFLFLFHTFYCKDQSNIRRDHIYQQIWWMDTIYRFFRFSWPVSILQSLLLSTNNDRFHHFYFYLFALGETHKTHR